jgi:hypothetical protein
MVHPPEVARVVGGEQHLPTPIGSATGAGGLDEKVPHESTEWIAAAGGHGGADRVVVYPRDEGDVTGLAPWRGALLAPIVIQQISSVKVLDSCAASVEDRSQRSAFVEPAKHVAESADPLLKTRPQVWGAQVEDVAQRRDPRVPPLLRIVARAASH